MKKYLALLALLLLGLALAPGCGGDDESGPFVGSWYSETGSRITFTDKTWEDSDGDSGTYAYTGDYPVYELTMDTAVRRFLRRATFADVNTMELCQVFPGGSIGTCVNLVIDRPTLH